MTSMWLYEWFCYMFVALYAAFSDKLLQILNAHALVYIRMALSVHTVQIYTMLLFVQHTVY